jgi:hypothetical protein
MTLREPQGDQEYDWRIDAYESWELALATIRARKIREGVIALDDAAADQSWFERMRRKADGE